MSLAVPSAVHAPGVLAGGLPAALAAVSSTPSDGATGGVEQTAETVVSTTVDILALAWKVGVGALLGIVAALVVVVTLRAMGRHRALYTEITRFTRNALYVLGGLLGAYVGATLAVDAASTPLWATYVLQAVLIGVILAATWVAVGLAKATESSVVMGVRARGDAGQTNRVTTQTQILRRVVEAIIIICGLVGAIMTFPSARTAMVSLLASAGLVSVIAGLAAQSTLGNVFAGIQLATSDAIRVDDIVVVDGEQGTIEEITLTYVVVHVWDDRRLIYPSSHFTQNAFANWSRRGTQHVGTLTMDLDWRVPVAMVRVELARIVAASSTWDGRTANLDVTDTSGGTVTLRIAVSGANPGDVFTLQCRIREELVGWLQREAPYALPRTRVEVDHIDLEHDPEPERVARLAEELVTLQQSGGSDPAAAATSVQRPVDGDPIEAARVRAAAKAHAGLRRARREKVRRRRILAREPQRREDATAVISTEEQEAYLEARARRARNEDTAVDLGAAGAGAGRPTDGPDGGTPSVPAP